MRLFLIRSWLRPRNAPPGWADHAADSHSSPSAVPWQQTQTPGLSGQHLPFSGLKIPRVWQLRGTRPWSLFTCSRQRWMGTGSGSAAQPRSIATEIIPPAPPGSSSSPKGARAGGCPLRELGIPWEGDVSRDWAFPWEREMRWDCHSTTGKPSTGCN